MARRLVSVRIKGDPTNAELQVRKSEIYGKSPHRYIRIRPNGTSLVDKALAKDRTPEKDGSIHIPIE